MHARTLRRQQPPGRTIFAHPSGGETSEVDAGLAASATQNGRLTSSPQLIMDRRRGCRAPRSRDRRGSGRSSGYVLLDLWITVVRKEQQPKWTASEVLRTWTEPLPDVRRSSDVRAVLGHARTDANTTCTPKFAGSAGGLVDRRRPRHSEPKLPALFDAVAARGRWLVVADQPATLAPQRSRSPGPAHPLSGLPPGQAGTADHLTPPPTRPRASPSRGLA
jgi:hypothetical protein